MYGLSGSVCQEGGRVVWGDGLGAEGDEVGVVGGGEGVDGFGGDTHDFGPGAGGAGLSSGGTVASVFLACAGCAEERLGRQRSRRLGTIRLSSQQFLGLVLGYFQ